MSKITDDTTTIEFPPLRRKWTRTAAVTAQLAELSRLRKSTVLRRVFAPEPSARLERETLVALVRVFERAGDTEAAGRVLEELLKRVDAPLKVQVRRWSGLTPEDRTDAAQQMVAHICDEVRKLTPEAEFWECNFTTCLARRLASVWHRVSARRVPTVSLILENADGAAYDALAQVADPRDMFADIDVNAMIQMLSRHHPKLAEAIFLRMNDFSDEEIAERLGITSRTLRYWTAQARTLWEREAAL